MNEIDSISLFYDEIDESSIFPLRFMNRFRDSYTDVDSRYLVLRINEIHSLDTTCLRLCLWKDSYTRISQDFDLDLHNARKEIVFIFQVADHSTSFDGFLTVDAIEDKSGIPLMSTSKKISIRDFCSHLTQNYSIPLRFTHYVDATQVVNTPQGELSVSICPLTVAQPFIGADLTLLSQYSNQCDYRLIPNFIASGQKNSSSRTRYLTIEDFTLNEDILDLYRSRHLSVVLTLKGERNQIVSRVFLGTIFNFEGNWLELCQCDISDPAILDFEVEVFVAALKTPSMSSSSTQKSGNTNQNGTVELQNICSGKLSPSIGLSLGTFSVDLFTEVTGFATYSNASSAISHQRRISVGKLMLKTQTFIEQSKELSAPLPAMEDVERLLAWTRPSNSSDLLERDRKEVLADSIVALGSICRGVSKLSYNPISPLSKSFHYYMHQLDKVLTILGFMCDDQSSSLSGSSAYEDILHYLKEQKLVVPFFFAANAYFSEWLTTDIAKDLMTLRTSQEGGVPTNFLRKLSSWDVCWEKEFLRLAGWSAVLLASAPASYFTQLTKLRFLLQLLHDTHPVEARNSREMLSSAEMAIVETFEIADKGYLSEVAAEFCQISQGYRSMLLDFLCTFASRSSSTDLVTLTQQIHVISRSQRLVNLFHSFSSSFSADQKNLNQFHLLSSHRHFIVNSLVFCHSQVNGLDCSSGTGRENFFSLMDSLLQLLRRNLVQILSISLPFTAAEERILAIKDVVATLDDAISGSCDIIENLISSFSLSFEAGSEERVRHLRWRVAQLLRAIFITVYSEFLQDGQDFFVDSMNTKERLSRTSRVSLVKTSDHLKDVIQYYHSVPSSSMEEESSPFPSQHLYLIDHTLRPDSNKKRFTRSTSTDYLGSQQLPHTNNDETSSEFCLIRRVEELSPAIGFLLQLSERCASPSSGISPADRDLALLLRVSLHRLWTDEAIDSDLPYLERYTAMKKLVLNLLSRDSTSNGRSSLKEEGLFCLNHFTAVDRIFFASLYLHRFPKIKDDCSVQGGGGEEGSQRDSFSNLQLARFSVFFLQSYQYYNGSSSLLYSTAEDKTGTDLNQLSLDFFRSFSGVTRLVTDILFLFLKRLHTQTKEGHTNNADSQSKVNITDQTSHLCYLLEVLLFWYRELVGTHFVANISSVGETPIARIMPLAFQYLHHCQRHSEEMIDLLWQTLVKSFSVIFHLREMATTRIADNESFEAIELLRAVVGSFQYQIVSMLIDLLSLQPLYETILFPLEDCGSGGETGLANISQLKGMIWQQQSDSCTHFMQLLVSAFSSETFSVEIRAAVQQSTRQILSVLFHSFPRYCLYRNQRIIDSSYRFLHHIRALSLSRELELVPGSLKNDTSSSKEPLLNLFLLTHRTTLFLSCLQDKFSVREGSKDAIKSFDERISMSLEQWIRSLDQATSSVSHYFESRRYATVAAVLQSESKAMQPQYLSFLQFIQRSSFASLSLVRFYLSLMNRIWQQNATITANESDTGSIVLFRSDSELSELRDTMQSLLSCGRWEDGIKLADFMLTLLGAWGGREASSSRISLDVFEPTTAVKSDAVMGLSPSRPLQPFQSPLKSSKAFSFSTLPDPVNASVLSLSQQNSPLSPMKSITSALFASPHVQSQIASPRSPRPPPPTATRGNTSQKANSSSSKSLRNDALRQELQRISAKLKDKVKFEGDLRFPKQYLAVRLLSAAKDSLSQLISSLSRASPASSTTAPISDNSFLSTLELLHAVNHPLPTSVDAEETDDGERCGWHEMWLIFSFDLVSYRQIATYYSKDFLEVLQHRLSPPEEKNPSRGLEEEDLASLRSPISSQEIINQIQQLLPDYQYLSPVQAAEGILDPDHVVDAYLRSHHLPLLSPNRDSSRQDAVALLCDHMKFFQCFPAFPAVDVNAHVLSVSEEEGKDSAGEEEKEEKEEKREGREMLDGARRDESEQMSKSSSFFVYCLDSRELPVSSPPSAFSRPIIRFELSLPDVSLPFSSLLESALTGLPLKLSDIVKNTTGNFPTISLSLLSPVLNPVTGRVDRLSYLQCAQEVLSYYWGVLQRAVTLLTHLNELSPTEILNQPEHSLLHSDTLFWFIVDVLIRLFESPNLHIIGPANVDLLVIREKEKFETEWQRIRKLMKREYMRSLQTYEDELLLMQEQSLSAPDLKRPLKGKKSSSDSLVPPTEPDFVQARKDYEDENELQSIRSVELLRERFFDCLLSIFQQMKLFLANSPHRDKREDQQLPSNEKEVNGGGLTEEQRWIDNDYSLKMKLLMFVESLYSSAYIGVNL